MTMLEDIKKLFRDSVEAFRREAGTRDPEDEIAGLLSSMRRELVAARAALPEYENDIRRARSELAREDEAIAVCERRLAMAEKINDTETARVAREFADRHRERATILRQKLAAVEAELDLKRREAEEMTKRYKEADANRFALLAQLRTSAAGARMRGAHSSETGTFADFDRMQRKVEHDAAYLEALEELDGHPPPPSPDPRHRETEVEEKLRELKRRMGRTE